jgi:hypothetical protein
MLEHVRNGGRPYDVRGQHIAEMVTELNVLSRFRRANHGRIFEGDTAALVEQTNAYYETARRALKSLSTKSGYNTYFESWDPEQVTEEAMVIEGLKHLFITQTLDQRIEEALPILARIQQQGTEMKEANIFEAWARQLVEGTWATPDTPEKRATLVQLMSAEFPVGPDATNATEQLYDIMGDDVLFDRLETLSTQDADADARQIIYDRMQELTNDPNVRAAMSEFTMDQKTPADEPAEPMGETVKDPADQTEDPQGTKQPDYDEYADSLKNILQRAGVDDTVKAAPPYEASVEEDAQPGVVADFDEAENLSPFTEGDKCNMTEAGEMCPQHGMMECGMEGQDNSPLAGQYGHSGKMKPVEKDVSFLDRLKELSGMMRK